MRSVGDDEPGRLGDVWSKMREGQQLELVRDNCRERFHTNSSTNAAGSPVASRFRDFPASRIIVFGDFGSQNSMDITSVAAAPLDIVRNSSKNGEQSMDTPSVTLAPYLL